MRCWFLCFSDYKQIAKALFGKNRWRSNFFYSTRTYEKFSYTLTHQFFLPNLLSYGKYLHYFIFHIDWKEFSFNAD